MKCNSTFPIIFSFILSSISLSTYAGIINLGAAKDYNAFMHQDFTATSSDVEGRLAAGGNISISSYSVNIKNDTQLYSDTNHLPALVAGGNLAFSSGQIAGDVYVGGTYTQNNTGSITNGRVQDNETSPIDFDAEFTYLTNLATDLSLLESNGTAISQWSSLNLSGAGKNDSGNDLHVFNLDSSDMLFSDYFLSDVDANDTVLFNVAGKDITTSWGDFGGSDNSLVNMSNNILFNFFEAETIQINAAMFGSILAPSADIKAPHGVIWGQVIANSWLGNTQINDNPFTDTTVEVPEPTYLFMLSFICLAFIRRIKP